MTLTLAAVGAVAVALLQSTVVPYLEIEGARPDLILVYTVIVTIVIGLDHGLTSAFFGGLTIDALAPRPIGSTAFVLLVVVGVAAIIGRALSRTKALSTIVAIFVTAVLAPLLFLGVYGALRGPIAVSDPLLTILPDAVYTTAVGAVAGPLVVLVHRRRFERDRIDW
jgi:rod shape-determining protein MreD